MLIVDIDGWANVLLFWNVPFTWIEERSPPTCWGVGKASEGVPIVSPTSALPPFQALSSMHLWGSFFSAKVQFFFVKILYLSFSLSSAYLWRIFFLFKGSIAWWADLPDEEEFAQRACLGTDLDFVLKLTFLSVKVSEFISLKLS